MEDIGKAGFKLLTEEYLVKPKWKRDATEGYCAGAYKGCSRLDVLSKERKIEENEKPPKTYLPEGSFDGCGHFRYAQAELN